MNESSRAEEKGPLPRTREAVDWWLKKWGRSEVVEGKEPLNRGDVERLIEVNGGTADRLHFNTRNLMGADLQGADLQGAYLHQADLHGAQLTEANLREADLTHAVLKDAILGNANLQGTAFNYANLQGTYLSRANL